MHRFLLILLLLGSCSFNMGSIPVVVKELKEDEIDYAKLMKRKEKLSAKHEERKDCLHLYLFIPTKMSLDMQQVLGKSCKESNYSFQNKLRYRFFYFLYGNECFVSEHYCEDT